MQEIFTQQNKAREHAFEKNHEKMEYHSNKTINRHPNLTCIRNNKFIVRY